MVLIHQLAWISCDRKGALRRDQCGPDWHQVGLHPSQMSRPDPPTMAPFGNSDGISLRPGSPD